MSDAITTPLTPKSDNPQKKWLLGLAIFGIITLLSLVYLVYSLSKVTTYLGHINQMEVSAANIVRDVNDATLSRDFDISADAYSRLQKDIASYESALNHAKTTNMGAGSVLDELSSDWQAKKAKVSYILEHKNDIDSLQDLNERVVSNAGALQSQYGAVLDQAWQHACQRCLSKKSKNKC